MQWNITHLQEKYESLPFATTWMDLEDIMLSEINQRKTNIACSHICGNYTIPHISEYNKTDSQIKKRNQQLPAGRGKEGARQEQGMKRYKQLCIKEITKIHCTAQGIQPLFYNNIKQSIIYKNGGSLHCTLASNIILYINYTSI